jgi:hypothetical protein
LGTITENQVEHAIMTRTLIAVSLLGAVLAGGCASAPQPSADLTQARTLVEQAEQSGAAEFASADLASARSKLQMADHQAHDKPEQSIRLAQEASVDARVALARTNAAKAQVALRDVNAGTRTLRNETDRAQPDSSMPVPPTSATPQ